MKASTKTRGSLVMPLINFILNINRIVSVCFGLLLTVMSTLSWPCPASFVSMLNSTGKLAGTPLVRPGPLARTLLAS